METTATEAALAVLRFWATGGQQDAAPHDEGARRAAWLLTGSDKPMTNWPKIQSGPLSSIFNLVEAKGGGVAPQTVVPRGPLSLKREVLFPYDSGATEHTRPTSDTYDPVSDLARAAAVLAEETNAEIALEKLLTAFQRHGWCLPSPLHAVSLYDFARTHAALASALAGEPEGEVCLVCGDLSGVQEFIYSVAAKGATKQLRGRSLYLQLLTDACAHFVLREAGMPLCNLIYAGGGRFYALLPGRAQQQIGSWRREIGRRLLKAHRGALYLALGGACFRPDDYSADTWRAMSDAADQDKRRRFAALDAAEFAKLFKPHQPEPPAADAEADAPEPLNRLAESLQQLGGKLSRAKLLLVEPNAPYPLGKNLYWYEIPASLGLRVRLLDDEREYQAAPGQRRRLLRLSDEVEDLAPKRGDVVGTRYTVTEAKKLSEDVREAAANLAEGDELRAGDVTPFNMLADQSQGVKRLGVLRMDVDDLGDLFGTRLGRGKGLAALAVTAALSGSLSRFFEGWVGELCRQANADGGRGGVYAVYSGGDDLFLVGSWHRMPGLARSIRDDFARYVLGRALKAGEAPPITLSAGLTLHGGSYPLYQAADDADRALDRAKAFARPAGRRKDAITFLGRTLGWEQFAEADAICATLVDLITKQGAPQALLMTIQSLDVQARQGARRSRDGASQFTYGPWIWQGAYQFTRMAERASTKTGKQIADLRDQLVGADAVSARSIERAGLAARWAQLLIRGGSSDKEEGR